MCVVAVLCWSLWNRHRVEIRLPFGRVVFAISQDTNIKRCRIDSLVWTRIAMACRRRHGQDGPKTECNDVIRRSGQTALWMPPWVDFVGKCSCMQPLLRSSRLANDRVASLKRNGGPHNLVGKTSHNTALGGISNLPQKHTDVGFSTCLLLLRLPPHLVSCLSPRTDLCRNHLM